jgi:hypothetical protein
MDAVGPVDCADIHDSSFQTSEARISGGSEDSVVLIGRENENFRSSLFVEKRPKR